MTASVKPENFKKQFETDFLKIKKHKEFGK